MRLISAVRNGTKIKKKTQTAFHHPESSVSRNRSPRIAMRIQNQTTNRKISRTVNSASPSVKSAMIMRGLPGWWSSLRRPADPTSTVTAQPEGCKRPDDEARRRLAVARCEGQSEAGQFEAFEAVNPRPGTNHHPREFHRWTQPFSRLLSPRS